MIYKNALFTTFTFVFFCFVILSSSPAVCQTVANGLNNNPDRGYITTKDNVRLFYQKVGDGPQKVILPGHFLLYKDFHHLSEGRTLVFYDMRDRGQSKPVYERNKISMQHDIQDLEEIRSHFGFDKVSLIGYSYLGKMVAMYAKEYPDYVERIVQLGPVPIKFGTQYPDSLTANNTESVIDEEQLTALREKREQNFHLTHPKEYCEEEWLVTRGRLIGNQDNIDKMGESHCRMPNEWPVNLARHFSARSDPMQQAGFSAEDAKAINIPVLVIHGTKDRNAPFGSGKEWAALFPDSRFIRVKGAAHRSWIDTPDLVFESIDQILKNK